MGLEVGGRAAIERLSGTPQGLLTATRGERGESERDRERLTANLSLFLSRMSERWRALRSSQAGQAAVHS